MFNRVEKVDHSTPGFSWKPMEKCQGIKGKMYTAWPFRLATRFWPAMGFGLLWGVMTTGGASFGGIFAWMLFWYGVFLIWPAKPFARSIQITPEKLSIGGKGYDVNAVQQFRVMQKSFSKNFPSYMIVFEYGRKTIKIKNAHKEKDAYRIAEALHQLVHEAQGVQVENQQEEAEATTYQAPEQARAAAF